MWNEVRYFPRVGLTREYSNDHISLNESGSGSSKAMSRRTLHRHTLTQPEVGTLDSSGNISASLNPLKRKDCLINSLDMLCFKVSHYYRLRFQKEGKI